MAAVRVSFTWMGTQKTLDPDQRARAAEAFGAEGTSLSAGKKLIDTRHPAFRAVTAIRGQVDAYWKGLSLPFPEPGVRLIRHDAVEAFAARMAAFRAWRDNLRTGLREGVLPRGLKAPEAQLATGDASPGAPHSAIAR